MYSVEVDRSKRLLVITAAKHVTAQEVKQAAQEVRKALEGAEPGIRALTDFRWLESMEPSAAPYVADIMDALTEKQVSAVIRVMPDPRKDIGLNILSQFHYDPAVRIATFETLADALQSLAESE
jgi:hypothetical protein